MLGDLNVLVFRHHSEPWPPCHTRLSVLLPSEELVIIKVEANIKKLIQQVKGKALGAYNARKAALKLVSNTLTN